MKRTPFPIEYWKAASVPAQRNGLAEWKGKLGMVSKTFEEKLFLRKGAISVE